MNPDLISVVQGGEGSMNYKEGVKTIFTRIVKVFRSGILQLAFLKEWLLHRIRKEDDQGFSMFSSQVPENEEQGTRSADSVEPLKILVSYCLYGEKTVRYDGREIPLNDGIFLKWKNEGRLIPVCPEVEGGLPVPRLRSERSGKKVLSMDGRDVTQAYKEGAIRALQLARQYRIAFAIMKDRSPSCGSSNIYDGTFTGKIIHGEGMAVELLRNAGISVFSEKDLKEAAEYLADLESGDQSAENEEGTINIRSGIMRGIRK